MNLVFRSGDMLDANVLGGEKFDLIVSNPPYVTPEEYETLIPCVRDYEDPLALFGGDCNQSGMEFHAAIVKLAKTHLRGGMRRHEHAVAFDSIPRLRLDDVDMKTDLPRVWLEFSGKNRRYAVMDLAERLRVPTTIWKDFRDKDRLMTVDI